MVISKKCILANILRKLAAIFLIVLFTFNLIGYRALFYFAQQQSDIKIEKSLDSNQYNEEDLITIKIPISVPYQTEWSDFERYDGEVNFNGKIYKYVKRKVCDGNLVLLCLPYHEKMRLEAAKNDLCKNTSDLQNPGTKKSDNSKSALGKNLSNEYNQNISDHYIFTYNVFNKQVYFTAISLLTSASHSSPEQPPEIV